MGTTHICQASRQEKASILYYRVTSGISSMKLFLKGYIIRFQLVFSNPSLLSTLFKVSYPKLSQSKVKKEKKFKQTWDRVCFIAAKFIKFSIHLFSQNRFTVRSYLTTLGSIYDSITPNFQKCLAIFVVASI